MANDPLAVSGIGAELPQEAEYGAVYAAVTATERGRWFLSEFANRNRHADTDSLVAALARIEAVVGNEAAADGAGRSRNAAAAEKIQAIAAALRERAADPALCDALDAAVREICDAGNNGSEGRDGEQPAAPFKADEVAAWIEALSEEAPQSAANSDGENDNSRYDEFEFELQDKEKFAKAAVALAASLGLLVEQNETTGGQESAPSAAAPQPPVIPQHDYTAIPQSAHAEPAASAPRWYIEPPDFVFHPATQRANGAFANSPGEPGRTHSLLPALQLQPSPEDDPAELFEELAPRLTAMPDPAAVPHAAPPASVLAASASSAPSSVAQAADIAPPSPAAAPVRTVPRPAPINPLAALRGLTEDELLALFG